MRYYVVKLSWDKEFRFEDARDASLFLANAAEHVELDEENLRGRGHDEASFDFYVKEIMDPESEIEEPETEEPDPEIVRPGELDLHFEEVANGSED